MNTRYVVLLSHADGSGPIQAFGPYNTEALAQDAMADLQAWPALSNADKWELVPCADTSTPTCGAVKPGDQYYSEFPCVLAAGHRGDHLDREGDTW
jgi:hypothetical protein